LLVLFSLTTIAGCLSAPAFVGECWQPRLANRVEVAKLLPVGITLNTVTSFDSQRNPRSRVEYDLAKIGARIETNGKLCDKTGKEIRFFQRPSIGAHLFNIREIYESADRELTELKMSYTVIAIPSNHLAP
jgi:hypothetical protein